MPMKRALPFLYGCILFSFCLAGRVAAEDALSVPWQIAADRLTTERETGVVVAEGNVVLSRSLETGLSPLTIRADHVRYNKQEGMIQGRGNVSVESEGDRLTAEEATFFLNRETGVLKRTTLFYKEDNLYFTGRVVEKTGPLTYHLKDGWVTSCRVPPGGKAPWAFSSKDVSITLDGYALLKHATFRIKDVPVLYLPYMIVPAKGTRQTGLLLPEISHSDRDGSGFILPFFVNLSPSADITFYPGMLDKRGTVAGLELRYAADYLSQGALTFSYLEDRTEDTVEDDYKDDGFLRTERDRYWLRSKIDHYFSDSLALRLDADYVTDRDYLYEYRDSMIGFDSSHSEYLTRFHRGFQEKTVPFRESALQLAKTWPAAYLGGEVQGIRDVTEEIAATTTAVQTLPRLLFTGRPLVPWTPLTLAWESEYVNYWREEGVGAQRLDLRPALLAPLPLGRYLEGKVSAGLKETLYRVKVYGDETLHAWPHAEDNNRTIGDFSVNLGTTLSRDFKLGKGSVQWLNHLVRPNIRYRYVTATDQDDLPELDGVDRIDPENLLTYELNSYFRIGGRRTAGSAYARDLGYFKINQSYDIREERRDLLDAADKRRPFSDIDFDLALYPVERMNIRYQTTLNVYGEGVSSYDLLGRYSNERGDSLGLDYRYERGVSHQLNLSLQSRLTDLFTVKGRIIRSLDDDHTVDSMVGLVYHPHCWAVEVQGSKSTDDKRVMVIFSLTGLGEVLELGN